MLLIHLKRITKQFPLLFKKKIRLGKIEEVNKLLGRNWCVIGKVIKGRRGRKIGFPTCNLKLNDYVVPKLGVYAVKVKSNNFYKKWYSKYRL